ncbi:CaiB/BaiF CoA transferase family protein [Prosthecomicrobium sp. N25]|uniref:CaiB/BaiF CoA transferase family protein n=1 Tax=Prosthecomicrobium sp. N25 TaxID=3129254 RepID=UPI0030788C29
MCHPQAPGSGCVIAGRGGARQGQAAMACIRMQWSLAFRRDQRAAPSDDGPEATGPWAAPRARARKREDEILDSALAGLRILDLSDSIAGQFCTRIFADHGADVVLVEGPSGSPLRRAAPLSRADGSSLLFRHLNTGKRSVVLDRAAPEDRARLDRLLGEADVVVLPGDLSDRDVARLNPDSVTVRVSPFGTDGPLAGWKGPEIVLQALSGMMFNNGAHGREPLYGSGARASFAAGLAAYVGAAAALLARPALGRGQHVAVDEAETAAAMCFPYVMQHIYNGTLRSRADLNIPAGQVLCHDGWVCIWIYNHRWTAVCRTLGLEDLEADPRFADPAVRRDNWAALFAIIQERVAGWEAEDLVDRLQRAEVIAAKSFGLAELGRNRHLDSRGYWEFLADGRRILGPAYRFGATPRRVERGAPGLGETGVPAEAPEAGGAPRIAPGSPGRGPLAGLRVVEVATAWAGPMAGRVLAFLGAESIHVESPNRVNSWRLNKDAPNPVNFPDGVAGERPFDRSFLFNSQNVNKLSCILDLKTEEGRTILRDLAARSDVILCNFRPGTLRKFGLDYDGLKAVRPEIVVAELPAFGKTGPMSGYAALGPTMEMATGMSSLIGYEGGQPETTGPSYLDPIGGFNTAAAILTALLHRQRTGQGQAVEIPQVEAAMQFIGAEILAAIETGEDPPRRGNRSPHAVPHDAFPTRGEDEWMVIAARSDSEWRTLAAAIGRPELGDDPRFASLEARRANEDTISALLADWTRGRDKHEAADLLQAAGVPAAPVMTPSDLARSEYLAHRGFYTWLEHPDAGRHPHPGLPLHLSLTPGGQRRHAPPFGADNGTVLRDILGLPPETIARAEAAGAVTTWPLPGA